MDDEIEQTLRELHERLEAGIDFPGSEAHQTAKRAIQALLIKARIDEVKEIGKSIERIEDNNVDTGMSYWVQDRTATLTAQLKGLEK